MPKLKFLSTLDSEFGATLDRILQVEQETAGPIEASVDEILAAVRAEGDAALVEYTNRFDRTSVSSVEELALSRKDLRVAKSLVDESVVDALTQAADRIRDYHERQKNESWSYIDDFGNRLGQKITAINSVGLYVPGGKAAYPSSVLMNAIPAKVAGVDEVVMVVPCPDGHISPVVLAAADIANIDRVFKIGGAQAIGALAYGTETIPRVDKIVGPGNAYVAAAKKKVFGAVGIDMIAGPSEILIVCDGSVDVDWIVMDLFSQAEHDELAQSILISDDEQFLRAVQSRIEAVVEDMPRKDVISSSLSDRGALILVRDLNEACQLVNQIAPEHLELSVADPSKLIDQISNAGAIFVGKYTSESLGDYCAGPNHVLPTSGTARFSSPLGVYDFQKRSSVIEVSRSGARELGLIAATLAREEGLEAHAASAERRFK
ncbi:MAG: histidinol dehydrogenase [Betaproteobacteria bacterium]